MQELDRPTSQEASLTSYDPATGEALGSVPIWRPEAVDAAVARARAAFPSWRALGYGGRRAALRRYRDAFLEERDAIAKLLTRENGKPLTEAVTEVFASCEFLGYYAEHAEGLLKDEPIRETNPIVANKETFVAYEPKGVIAVISPWNFPLHLAMAEIAAALAAGNTVVLKPSELTPLVGQLVETLAKKAGLPEHVVQVVTGDGATGAALSAAAVDRVCFTGSVATGRKVAVSAMSRLVPVTLELGGKDPALVLSDADPDFSARGLTWAAFTNAGQVCASAERVYVHQTVAEPFLQKLLERTKALKVGNGLDPSTEIGPIINEVQLERIAAQVEDAKRLGAQVLTGGERLEGSGHFYAPTILLGVTDEMLVMREETFGPVLPVIVCADEEEMIARANASPYGLSATVWTRNTEHGKQVARRLEAGSVWVNTGLASYANPLMPRGGYKESGIGKIGGRVGLLEMVNSKLIDIAVHDRPKDWWYPLWPQAYQYMTAGLDLLHSSNWGRKAEGLLRLLRTKR